MITTKSSLVALALYLALLGGVGLYMERRLRAVSDSVLEETAQLIGREVAVVLAGPTRQQLLSSDPSANESLIEIVNQVTQHSQVVTSLLVVDANGTVIAGDEQLIGRQVSLPELVFGPGNTSRFFASKGLLSKGESYLFVPLSEQQQTVGYLRLALKSERIAKLYREARQQLLAAALLGFLFVVTLAFLLHLQLTRVGLSITQVLEGAVRGEPVHEPRGVDEFAQAFETAQRVGRELHVAREKSSEAQRRFKSLMHVMDVGVLLLNPNKELDFANNQARALLGCADTDALERRWKKMREDLDSRLAACQQGASGVQLNVDVPSDERSNALRLELYPLKEDDCQGYLILVKSREMIDALENELRLAIQMRANAHFYMAFAHDLRAPLNAMVLNLELLRESLRNGHKPGEETRASQQRYIEVLKAELSRFDRDLRVLLNQAALPNASAQEFDLRDLILDLGTLLGPQAKQQQVTLATRVPDEAVPFSGHRDRLKQALLNIAINALEATPTGGEVVMGLSAHGHKAQLWVTDNGPGIPPEILERIYNVHFTTKSRGTGIGLYVARSVVEAHGGDIRVESTPGHGTLFEVDLPLASS